MAELEPETYFSSLCITKNEVTLYGKALKDKLNEWHRRGLWDFVGIFDIFTKNENFFLNIS